MMAKANGTCLRHWSRRMKAWMLKSWAKGSRTTLNVPSTNQCSALERILSWSSVAKMRSREPSARSATRKSGGRWWSSRSKSRVEGCWGRVACLARFVRRWRRAGSGRMAPGSSVLTSLMADSTIFPDDVKQCSGCAAFSFSWKEKEDELIVLMQQQSGSFRHSQWETLFYRNTMSHRLSRYIPACLTHWCRVTHICVIKLGQTGTQPMGDVVLQKHHVSLAEPIHTGVFNSLMPSDVYMRH